MEELLQTLQKNNKHVLSQAIRESYLLTIEEYIEKLYQYRPLIDFEPELKEAFSEQISEELWDDETRLKVLDDLETYRTIQTAPHTSLISYPRMFCIDWMSIQGKPKDSFYITGSFSGVPFSNKTHPAGKLIYKDETYNLIPSRLQDALVYSAVIDESIQNKISTMPQDLQTLLLPTILNTDYTTWANRTRTSIQRSIFNNDDIIIFDINRVVTKYILKIIEKNDPSHPLYKILFNTKVRDEFLSIFGENIHFFYTPYLSKKYHKQESLYINGYCLDAKHTTIKLAPDFLKEKLLSQELCPATILTFTVLSFLNGFQCFGSFAQVEYLTDFKKKYEQMSLLNIPHLDSVPTMSLTTGMFPKNKELSPLSVLLGDKEITGKPTDTLEEYYLAMSKEMLLY
ncbi:MAG: hypothetical protein ACI9AR_000239 [Flavobacteriaceae bacterium]|jgi:hypothetical protein